MTRLIRLAEIVSRAPVALAVGALFVMMVMTFADVVLRSAFDSPIEAATEITRILMAVVVFAVLPVISGRGGHISVDLLDGWFGPMASRIRDAAVSLICGAALWYPANRCWALAERAHDYGDVTEYLAIPQFYIGAFIAVATFAAALALIVRGVVILVGGRAG